MLVGLLNRLQAANEKKDPSFIITWFDLWVLCSSLCTTVGGILSLYGTDKFGDCRFGLEVAATVIQGIALIFCLIAITIAAWKTRDRINARGSSLRNSKTDSFSMPVITTTHHSNSKVLQVLILLIVNIASLLMVIIILINRGCSSFVYNAIYNIFGVVGAFIIQLIASFKRPYDAKQSEPSRSTTTNNPPTRSDFPRHRQLGPSFSYQPHPQPIFPRGPRLHPVPNR